MQDSKAYPWGNLSEPVDPTRHTYHCALIFFRARGGLARARGAPQLQPQWSAAAARPCHQGGGISDQRAGQPVVDVFSAGGASRSSSRVAGSGKTWRMAAIISATVSACGSAAMRGRRRVPMLAAPLRSLPKMLHLGTPRRNEPRTSLARPGQAAASSRTACTCLRVVH